MAATTITKFAHLQIPLEDVLNATNNFHNDKIIGHGGFGPAYKGQLLRSGELIKIAARRLDRKYGAGHIEFWTEIAMLSDLKHTNLVSLVGFCDEKDEKVIITTYEANGSLKEHLNNPNLTWMQKLRISVGVARALSYLYHDEGRSYGVIHRNINSSTILLDENWEPKLSGFEISIKQAVNRMDQIILSDPIGTIGYMDPEIVKIKGVTHKSDVYAFGVVLFELLCGRRAYSKSEANRYLAHLAKDHYENETLQDIIHSDLRNQMSRNQISRGSLKKYSKTAYSCLKEERAHRPHMLIIVDELQKAFDKALKFKPRPESFVKNLDHLRIRLDDIKLATHNFTKTIHTSTSNNYARYTVELDHLDKEKPYSIKGKSKTEQPKRHNIVVIKRFLPRDEEDEEELFFTELEILTTVRHHNIVTLRGFCLEGFEMMLVVENFSNGFLTDYLLNVNKLRTLTWEKRLKICIDVASGLNYIHSEMEEKKMIIHGNIASFKFGLDENWVAKIEDFEWAVKMTLNEKDEALCKRLNFESRYHVDPEYAKTGKLKRESDVYSFGVVLYEVICGRYAADQFYHIGNEKGLVHVARQNFYMGTIEDILDPTLKEETSKKSYISNRGANKDSLHTVLQIANQCVAEIQNQRPTMAIVLKELQKALYFQEERVHQLGKDQVKDESDKATHEIQEEGIERPYMVGVVHKLKKASEPHKMLEIKVNNLEHLKIPLSHILSATHDFSRDHKIATPNPVLLYRAELEHYDKEDHSSKRRSTVLIKRYPNGNKLYAEEHFRTEIKILSSVKHPNIVTLLGFCIEASEMILVIEDFSNGFLADYLMNFKDRCVLTWEKRLKICLDVAHALKYIHYEMEDKTIINCDIWSNNIGLDGNWGAKIVDFWFSVILPSKQHESIQLDWIGRNSYVDPEYKKTKNLKRKSDVYGFGVVLFEILHGRMYLEKSDGLVGQRFWTETLEDKIDSVIKEETSDRNFFLNKGPNRDSLNKFIKTAYECVAETHDIRPSMKIVVKNLEETLLFQKNHKDNPKMSLEEINQATQNFHSDNCIGKGGFGSVYKGTLQNGDGFKTIVAKRLDTRFGQGERQFFSELQILLDYKHDNVIGLEGYCDENDEKLIIYEYASKGSLDRHLNDASLTWVKRLNICIDVASALYFLHGGGGKQAKVIHRDIKSANILLDHDWKAKLADFGLSIISPLTHETDYVIDHACGTPGYLDPIYRKLGFLTIESDIYSFGVVLFEMLCGKSTFIIRKHEGHYMSDFIRNKFEEGKHDDVVFGQIREQMEPKSLTTFRNIAYRCLHHEREERPTTKEVLTQLKRALSFQNMPLTKTLFAPLRIPLEDVVKATNNFHADYIIQHDGISTTYKGRILHSRNEMKIAARRFDCKHEEGELKFLKEFSMLSDLKHKNLVSIIGFSDEKNEKIIITTYEASGSLGQHLHNLNLTWKQRLRICVGLAHALSYLRYDKGRDYAIIHCNITSDTILLSENGEAQLSGFENSIKKSVNDKDHVFPCEHTGIVGCVDPTIEKMGGVTYTSDIYSFGVVLFEILCGRKSLIQNEGDMTLAQLAKYHYEKGTLHDIIQPHLLNQILSPKSLLIYSDLAYYCLNDEARVNRPCRNCIVAKLEIALELQLRRENIAKKFEHLKIPLRDIKFATDNFSEKYKFASSSFDKLYTAALDLLDNENPSSTEGKNNVEHRKGRNTVLIKRYHSRDDLHEEENFFTQIEMLNSVKHPNIVTLLGFCVEGFEMILVLDNFSNGFLVDYLGNFNMLHILTWEKRLKICIDIAHALKYIHFEMEDQKVIINGDIWSNNIGLDENFGAKIVDFRCSVFLPPNQEYEDHRLSWFVRPPYIDPEYEQTSKLKRESDVYSFGVVMFEVLFGTLAYHPMYLKESDKELAIVARRSFCAGTLEDMIDPILKEENSENNFVQNRGPNKDSLHTFIEIANRCVAETQDQRPTMKVVVKELEKALLFQINSKYNPKIPLEDIKLATQNFHDDNCIGGEEFGKVYKGSFQDNDGVTIAVKRLDTRSSQGVKRFLSELKILWEYKNENVIGLVGYCDEQDEKIIVCEYASKGSLDRYLNDPSLTWMQRLNICINIASALDFIHGGVGKQTKVIHGDIKTSNILLNHNWKAKLADFGLSLISPIIQETEYVIDYASGTPGYVDPCYRELGFLTIESDIYSFGVVLFEILCGRSTFAIHEHEGYPLPDFIKNKLEEGKHDEVVFEQIREQIVPEALTTFQEIAYQCLHHEREKRPKSKEVLTQLKKSLEYQLNAHDQTDGSAESVYCWPCGFWNVNTTTLSGRLLRLLGLI